MTFKPLPDHELQRLGDEQLIAHIREARTAGELAAGRRALMLHTIVDRAAVDFYRRAERRPKESILPSGHGGEEEVWGVEPSIDSEAGAVELRMIVEEVLETFNEKHRLVIGLHVFGAFTASEVCDRIDGMTVDNVAKIASRFRAALRARLDPGSGDQR